MPISLQLISLTRCYHPSFVLHAMLSSLYPIILRSILIRYHSSSFVHTLFARHHSLIFLRSHSLRSSSLTHLPSFTIITLDTTSQSDIWIITLFSLTCVFDMSKRIIHISGYSCIKSLTNFLHFYITNPSTISFYASHSYIINLQLIIRTLLVNCWMILLETNNTYLSRFEICSSFPSKTHPRCLLFPISIWNLDTISSRRYFNMIWRNE